MAEEKQAGPSAEEDIGRARAVAMRLREATAMAKGHGQPVGLDYVFAEKLADLLERLAAHVEAAGTW